MFNSRYRKRYDIHDVDYTTEKERDSYFVTHARTYVCECVIIFTAFTVPTTAFGVSIRLIREKAKPKTLHCCNNIPLSFRFSTYTYVIAFITIEGETKRNARRKRRVVSLACVQGGNLVNQAGVLRFKLWVHPSIIRAKSAFLSILIGKYCRRKTLLGDRALAEIHLEPCTVQNHNRTVLDWFRRRIAPLHTFSRLNHYLRLFFC